MEIVVMLENVSRIFKNQGEQIIGFFKILSRVVLFLSKVVVVFVVGVFVQLQFLGFYLIFCVVSAFISYWFRSSSFGKSSYGGLRLRYGKCFSICYKLFRYIALIFSISDWDSFIMWYESQGLQVICQIFIVFVFLERGFWFVLGWLFFDFICVKWRQLYLFLYGDENKKGNLNGVLEIFRLGIWVELQCWSLEWLSNIVRIRGISGVFG